jgi:hypothetical protein
VQDNKFAGICVDFEEPPAVAQANCSRSCRSCTRRSLPKVARRPGVPFDDPDWNYKAYSAASDYLILMAYDQHWTGSDAGPSPRRTGSNRTSSAHARARCREDHHRARQLRLQLERRDNTPTKSRFRKR